MSTNTQLEIEQTTDLNPNESIKEKEDNFSDINSENPIEETVVPAMEGNAIQDSKEPNSFEEGEKNPIVESEDKSDESDNDEAGDPERFQTRTTLKPKKKRFSSLKAGLKSLRIPLFSVKVKAETLPRKTDNLAKPSIKGILKPPNPKWNEIVQIDKTVPEPTPLNAISNFKLMGSFVFAHNPNPTEPNSLASSQLSLASSDSLGSVPSIAELGESQKSLDDLGDPPGKLQVEKGRSVSSYDVFDEVHLKHLKAKKLKLRFSKNVTVGETYDGEEYARQGEFVAKMLTPQLAVMIKQELNEFKAEMTVHEDSKKYTQFYR